MPDVSQPTPQGAPTPNPANPPAPTPTPPAAPPAPVPTPPANPPAPQPTPPAQPPTPSGQQGSEKTFTQADVERILKDRMDRFEKSVADKQGEQLKKLAEAMGWQNPEAAKDPAELVKQAQAQATAEQQRADLADTRALALAAGVKADRIDLFTKLIDVGDVLKDVDRGDANAVSAALKSAVDSALSSAPEFKGSALPPSSGGDRGQPSANGKRVYTRTELQNMPQSELRKIAADLQLAAREGRIKDS